MADKASKLAAARKKLKDHQEKKHVKNVNTSGLDNTIPTNEKLEIQRVKHGDQIECRAAAETDSTLTYNHNVQNSEYSNANMYGEENCINATEILVSEKQNLTAKIVSLESLLQHSNNELKNNTILFNENIQKLEKELRESKKSTDILENKLRYATEKENVNEQRLKELLESNTELRDSLDSTKISLTARNTENLSLLSQLSQCKRDLEISSLHLQQLTSGHGIKENDSTSESNMLDQIKSLQQVNYKLEQQVKALMSDKEQLTVHCQHYMHQLNEQMESMLAKTNQQQLEVDSFTKREANLIDQISQMEIKIQALLNHISVLDKRENVAPTNNLSEKCYEEGEFDKAQKLQLEEDLKSAKKKNLENENIIIELNEIIAKMKSEQPDITKLNAANESDRVAAQRATAQNQKLKEELKAFEGAFIFMNNEKLELTEKLQAEKFLNRELTIKLSECEEVVREIQNKLQAKDEEMIRLQASCSILEKENLRNMQDLDRLRHFSVTKKNADDLEHAEYQALKEQSEEKSYADVSTVKQEQTKNVRTDQFVTQDDGKFKACQIDESEKQKILDDSNLSILPSEQAMLKLQQRFLKTMKELSDLTDEKQNLEHIVLQLQGETETICEYIALYQQQRGILRQREEERETQLKYLTSERERMQTQLEQLQHMITGDDDIARARDNTQQKQVDKIVNLLSEIKQNHLIDPHKACPGLENFHPCPWCSGKLIDV